MKDRHKTRSELLEELAVLRDRVAQLERAETMRQHAEAVVGETTERFQTLFTESPLSIILVDRNGNFVDINPAALKQLGVPGIETIRSLNLFSNSRWTEEELAKLHRGAITGIQTAIDFDEVKRLGVFEPTRSGVAYVDWIIAPMATSGYLMLLQDVTDRVRAEQKLEERESVFRQTFTAFPSPTLLWKRREDGQLVLELYNTAALEISKGKIAEFQGLTIDEFYQEDFRFPERVKRTFVTGETLRVETLYSLRTTGEQKWILATSAKVGEDRVLDTLTDITVIKQAETALRRSDANYRRIVETAQEGIWVIDGKDCINFANKSMADMLGYDLKELLGQTIFNFVREADKPALVGSLKQQETSNNGRAQFQFLCKDGSALWALLSVAPIVDDENAYTGTLGMMIDITDRVQAEIELRASLEEKELLLREIHHRVKNNLVIVSSLLDLQSTYMDDETVRHSLREGQNRILTVARLHEALHQSSDATQAHMITYIPNLAKTLGESLGRDDVLVEYDVSDVTMPTKYAVHVGLIINELVTNAFKHAFFDGKSSVKNIRITFVYDRRRYRLVISDNGQGLPAGFDPSQSSSLGLQVVYLLAEQLGGTLEWQSSQDSGTTITLVWPEKGGNHGDTYPRN